jgi:acetyltransferase-like isoleucine patch superfamily enzyme
MPIAEDVELGSEVIIHHPELVNLYGCSIGAGSLIGPFVEIGRGVQIGAYCRISSHSYICPGVTIEDEVFIGHGVMFINDLEPRAVADPPGHGGSAATWTMMPTLVKSGASVGTGAVVLGGLTIGAGALIGAGAMVSRDVNENAVVAGFPARLLRYSG